MEHEIKRTHGVCDSLQRDLESRRVDSDAQVTHLEERIKSLTHELHESQHRVERSRTDAVFFSISPLLCDYFMFGLDRSKSCLCSESSINKYVASMKMSRQIELLS